LREEGRIVKGLISGNRENPAKKELQAPRYLLKWEKKNMGICLKKRGKI